jgi:serine/threonine-protein kinase
VTVEIGQVVGSKYKLLRLLGDGGMGSVYEAEHLRLGTHVAIKVLHSDLVRRTGLMDRFLQEARVSAQIRSPHVVQVTDVESTDDGLAYLVMELLQGEPLASLIKRERPLPVAMVCEYTLQILSALEAAHALSVVHRDLKPDNVFVTFDGTRPVLKLIDFGIAKLKHAEGAAGAGQKNLTVAGMLMGTAEYMAPEQAYSATDVDARADLYSVGVMMYEMLCGKTPAQGDDPRIVVLKVERGEVTPLVHLAPNVPPELAGLVHRAMAPKAELRFASAASMRIALEALTQGKRTQTAKLEQVALPSIPPRHAAPAAMDLGTGTVMGAPAPAALFTGHSTDPPPANVANGQRPGTGTERSAPVDPYALARAQASAPAVTGVPRNTRTPPSRSGGGLVVALALVALLLGAGAVVAYFWDTAPPRAAVPPLPSLTGTTAAQPATATTAAQAVTVTTSPPLTPPVAVTTPRPTPTTTVRPPASSSAAPPPSVAPFPTFPSGFPSAIPFPSGFPTIPLPSGFPTFFPPSPPPPTP